MPYRHLSGNTTVDSVRLGDDPVRLREDQCGDDGKQKSGLPEHQGIPFSRWQKNSYKPVGLSRTLTNTGGWQVKYRE
jgi:hypothetical protein